MCKSGFREKTEPLKYCNYHYDVLQYLCKVVPRLDLDMSARGTGYKRLYLKRDLEQRVADKSRLSMFFHILQREQLGYIHLIRHLPIIA